MKVRARIAAAITAVAVLSITGAAGAAASTAGPQSTHSGFAAKAVAAGLATSQVRQVQSEVDTFISRNGGTQVALNKVDFNGGNIVFAVPGAGAHQLAGAGTTVAPLDSSCPFLFFCGWEFNNFVGSGSSKFELETCGVFLTITWADTTGSWMNNQSSGTRASFYGANHNLLSFTPPAFSNGNNGNWLPVFYVKAC